jgi:hypothetical protein
LQLVEHSDPDAKAVESGLLDGVPVEPILGYKLLDELLLFVGARPAVGSAVVTIVAVVVVTIATVEAVGAVTVLVSVGGRVRRGIAAVTIVVARDKAHLADFSVDIFLEESVETGDLVLHALKVRDLSFDRDLKTVRAECRKTQSFLIGC